MYDQRPIVTNWWEAARPLNQAPVSILTWPAICT